MYDRAILHMDLDSFFVSVEVLRNSALKESAPTHRWQR